MDVRRVVLVAGEVEEGDLSAITAEVLGGARRLADEIGGPVTLVLPGEETPGAARKGISLGADRVYVIRHPLFAEGNHDFCTYLLEKICKDLRPALCLMGQTDLGRDVAPRLATRLESGLCMDCIDVQFDRERGCFVQTRPAYGGKAMAIMTSPADKLQIDTVRAKTMKPNSPRDGQNGDIQVLADGFDSFSPRIRRTGSKKDAAEGMKIEDAKVIVAGGGGLGGAEGFQSVRELAKVLKGAVGASRVAVDEGWVPLSMEIGQTGKIVNPDLYITVGISGAAQHITGCIHSKKIVSINKDPDANIFRISDFGLVADYREALPIIIETIKSLNR